MESWCKKNGVELLEGNKILEDEICGYELEYYAICDILDLTTNAFKMWRKTWPVALKNVPRKKKAGLPEFRELLYGSEFFKKSLNIFNHLKNGMETYNKTHSLKAAEIMKEESISKIPIENYLKKLSENILPEYRPLLQAIEFGFTTQVNLHMELLKNHKELLEKAKKIDLEQEKNIELIN